MAAYSGPWLLNETIKEHLVQCLDVQDNVKQDRGAGVWRGHQTLEEGDRFGC